MENNTPSLRFYSGENLTLKELEQARDEMELAMELAYNEAKYHLLPILCNQLEQVEYQIIIKKMN